MTVSFPRDMPPCRISELSSFDLQHGVVISQAGGSVQAMELSPALWQASFVTEPLDKKQRAAVQAWWSTLKGGVGTFFAWDCFRAYPAAYGNTILGMPIAGGGGPFGGFCTVTANGTTTVGLSGLPANYEVTDGDMLELPRAGGKISLHNIVEAVTGSAGGTVTVTIEPPALSDTVIGSGAARVVKCRCIMVPKPGSLRIEARAGKTEASFDAIQTLR